MYPASNLFIEEGAYSASSLAIVLGLQVKVFGAGEGPGEQFQVMQEKPPVLPLNIFNAAKSFLRTAKKFLRNVGTAIRDGG